MISKSLYLQLKKDIKCLCRKNVIKLCDDMELNETERLMLLDCYDGMSVTHTSMSLHISEKTYNKYMKILFSKINDYKNTQ